MNVQCSKENKCPSYILVLEKHWFLQKVEILATLKYNLPFSIAIQLRMSMVLISLVKVMQCYICSSWSNIYLQFSEQMHVTPNKHSLQTVRKKDNMHKNIF